MKVGPSEPPCGGRLYLKGQFDFLVGGQLISLLVDNSCPCLRSADLLLI
jgi:hypothetical protein